MLEIPRRKLLGMTMAVFGFFTTLSTYNPTRSTDEQRELIHRAGLPNLLSQRVVEKAKSSLKS
jgi:hypothetical protein